MTDEEFLRSVGAVPEPKLVIQDLIMRGAIMRFEQCPMCGGRRHLNSSTGESHCVFCAARMERESRLKPMLVETKETRTADSHCGACELSMEEGHKPHIIVTMADSINLAQSAGDAEQWPARKCRMCGFDTGASDYCRACARDKFGDG